MDGRQARAFEFVMFALVLALVPDVEGQTVSGGEAARGQSGARGVSLDSKILWGR